MLKKIFDKDKLFIRVTIGFVLGIALGLLFPKFSISTKVVGDIYLNLIKMLVTPIVFCSVFCGVVNLKDTIILKKLGIKTIALFIFLFLGCAIVAYGFVELIKPGVGIVFDNPPVYEGKIANPSITSFILSIVPSNILKSLVNGDTLSIILFTLFFGAACLSLNSIKVIDFIKDLSTSIYKVFEYFMEFSPFGVCSLMAYSIAFYGSGIFTALAKYIIFCWVACIASFFIVFIIPCCLYTGISFKKLVKTCCKVSLVTMSTTSSVATLPTTLKVSIEDLGQPEDISNFVLPLGCTIHMCGGAVSFMGIMMFTAQFFGLELSLSTIIIGTLVSLLINMAAPGIPGGGIALQASMLTIMGLPIDLLGPVAGFYRLLDMIFTTMNVEGDIVANVIINKVSYNN